MDRRLLFPAVAITAWAQQPSPQAARAEAALHARAEQFFQLQVDKKYRQAEALVAEDSKDDYYNGNKYNIKGFTVQRIQLLDKNTRANVTITAKVTLLMPGAGGVDFDAPITSPWKIENGKWVWYVDHSAAVQTPFGKMTTGANASTDGKPDQLNAGVKPPDPSTLQKLVKVDRTAITLTPNGQPETVTVSNELPGGVNLVLDCSQIAGLSCELEKNHLEAGEKTLIRYRANSETRKMGVARLLISPVAIELEMQVQVK